MKFTERDGKVLEVEVGDLKTLDQYVNKTALEHYREMFKDIKSRGIHFVLNFYHWPLPLWVHDPVRVRKGDLTGPTGWLSTTTVAEFARFAAYVAWKFEDIADEYSTMNEPNVVWGLGYTSVKSGFPPGHLSFELTERAFRNIVQAHCRAYDAAKSVTRKPVGIIYANSSFEPLTEKDKEAAEQAEHDNRWKFFDAVIRGKLGEEVRDDLKGRLDWIGVNYYTRTVVKAVEKGYRGVGGYGHGCERNSLSSAGRPTSDFGWEFYPEGLHDVLVKYWRRYGLKMYVTENGIADEADYQRPYYLVTHLSSVRRAIDDGADVRGYLHWSLADNYEWASGFTPRFGLIQVDYSTKRQYWKPSALVYREVAKSSGVPDDLEHLNRVPPVKPLRH
ncbi:hypothetical protein HS1genome_1665 [Sulfodiicoccus acidiphilus]|uniref:Beta-galactosidase n=1 Tax=Sulfodiicoccus acidiphilus TaxID=1670455 RepID=A0A348B524_9CREN|nr:hypothetical protein HS1genome_1665 [Sulfodiicoccus acidiphilus]